MNDKVEKIGSSLIQHGKFNDRIYLMKLNNADHPEILSRLDNLAKNNNYSKIFAKIRERYLQDFLDQEYQIEASIPAFFKNGDKAYFLGKFYSEDRKNIIRRERIEKVIEVAESKKRIEKAPPIDSPYKFKIAGKQDAEKMVAVYKNVFPTYPFPIHDSDYIRQTMEENIIYFSIWEDDKLVALSSAEMDKEEKNVEMTDFATLPEYRGNGFALFLLDRMEEKMDELGINTFYTIARAVSFGMNITFARLGYEYTGTLKNNTNISGNIESMNIWYKLP